MKLSIIIPCYNEKSSILKIINLINQRVNCEKQIIIVDDFSTDGTRKLIKDNLEHKVSKIVYHEKNLGKGEAIKSAMPFIKGDLTIIQDADLEYDPNDINKIIDQFSLVKNCKVVYGSRALNNENYVNLNLSKKFRVFANYILTVFNNIINNQNLTDAHTCYKAFETKLFKELKLVEKRFAFCAEVNTKLAKKKITIYEIPIKYDGRSYKQGKKISLKDAFRSIYAILKYRFY